MKKLSLEMLRLTSDEVLQRSQMKKITGGYDQYSAGNYQCTCEAPAIGKWTAWYSSRNAANGSLIANCSNQRGNCDKIYWV